MSSQTDIAHDLAGIALFADLSPAQLDKVGQAFEEQWFQPGERAQRQGFVGSGFHVILDGEAEWRVDGELVDQDRDDPDHDEAAAAQARRLVRRADDPLRRAVDLGRRSPSTPLRCIVLPPQDLEPFLFGYPQVMYRLLLGEARRLRDPLRWQTMSEQAPPAGRLQGRGRRHRAGRPPALLRADADRRPSMR